VHQRLPLTQTGDHSINLLIDGTQVATVSLTIQRAKP